MSSCLTTAKRDSVAFIRLLRYNGLGLMFSSGLTFFPASRSHCLFHRGGQSGAQGEAVCDTKTLMCQPSDTLQPVDHKEPYGKISIPSRSDRVQRWTQVRLLIAFKRRGTYVTFYTGSERCLLMHERCPDTPAQARSPQAHGGVCTRPRFSCNC